MTVPAASLLAADPGASRNLQAFQSKPEFEAWLGNSHAELSQRRQTELTLMPAAAGTFSLTGYCAACESSRDFRVDNGPRDTHKPFEYSSVNWRESLICPTCGLNNRMRASVDIFRERMRTQPSRHVYMTEQVTPLYAWASNTFPGVIGSEYLGDDKRGGLAYERIRHEDTTRLSLGSDSLDWVLSFDVLEHIPDYQRALREMVRCLRPGGQLLLSAPFVSDAYETKVRARLRADGQVEHLLPPEYHGNPTLPGEGSLCFYHFGWDLLDEIGGTGVADARVLCYYSLARGNLGKPQLFFWARK